jgi:hypothetical protein
MPIDSNTYRGNLRNADPGEGSVAITPADDTDLTAPIRSLYVEAAGTVKFTGLDGNADTWDVSDNFLIPVAMLRVWATGTTATGLHGVR